MFLEADERDVWEVKWNASRDSAESVVDRLEETLGGEGISFASSWCF